MSGSVGAEPFTCTNDSIGKGNLWSPTKFLTEPVRTKTTGTAEKMDGEPGQRRADVERGGVGKAFAGKSESMGEAIRNAFGRQWQIKKRTEARDELALSWRQFIGGNIVDATASGGMLDDPDNRVKGVTEIDETEAISGGANPRKPATAKSRNDPFHNRGVARAVHPSGTQNGGGDAAGLLCSEDKVLSRSFGAGIIIPVVNRAVRATFLEWRSIRDRREAVHANGTHLDEVWDTSSDRGFQRVLGCGDNTFVKLAPRTETVDFGGGMDDNIGATQGVVKRGMAVEGSHAECKWTVTEMADA